MNYYDLPEWPAFLSAIRAAPDDDLPRLVAADFVEENGDAERAEFIRVQCELAKTPELVWRNKLLHRAEWDAIRQRAEPWGERLELASPSDAIGVYHYRETNQVHVKLYGRMSALADGIYGPLLGPVALAGGTWVVDRGFVSRVSAPLAVLHGGECECGGVEPCAVCNGSGQVDHPNGGVNNCPNWYDDGDHFTIRCVGECLRCRGTGRTPGVLGELLRREPITAVGIEVTDKEPRHAESLGKWHWVHEGNPHAAAGRPDTLPVDLWETDLISKPIFQYHGRRAARWFDSEDASRLALGKALFRLHGPKSEVTT